MISFVGMRMILSRWLQWFVNVCAMVKCRVVSISVIILMLFNVVLLAQIPQDGAMKSNGIPIQKTAQEQGQEQEEAKKTPRMPRIPGGSSTATVPIKKQFDNVVITGSRNEMLQSNSPVKVETISGALIQKTGAVNLGNILQEQTGLAITSNVRSGVQMMGLNSDYTLILIDGQPVVGRVAGVIDMNRISIGNVQQIEIVKGPMSSLYGSEALAGVINIITRKPEEGISARLYGQYLQRGAVETQAELTYGSSKLDVSTFLNVKHIAPFSLTQDTLTLPYSGSSDMTIQSRIRYYASNTAKFTLNTRFFRMNTEGAFIESFFGQIAANQGSVVQNDIATTLSGDFTMGKARLSVQSYVMRYMETYNFDVSQGSAGSVDDLNRTVWRNVAQYDVLWNEKNRFTLGGEVQLDNTGGSRYPQNPLYRTIVGFGQWEGNPTSWLSYALSARYDATNAFGNSFNPRFSLLVKPLDNLRVRSSLGTGFKAPDFRQMFVEFSNRLPGANYDLIGAQRLGVNLLPEQSIAFDAGVVWDIMPETLLSVGGGMGAEFVAPLTLDVRVYRNNLKDLIEFYYVGQTGSRAVYSYRNISQVVTQGIEVNFKTVIAFSQFSTLSWSLGYQYLDSYDVEVRTAIEKGVAGTVNPATGQFTRLTTSNYGGLWFRSRHSGNARVQYDHEDGWTANVRIQYVGRFGDEALNQNGFAITNPAARTVPDIENEFVPGYAVVNVFGSKNFSLPVNVVGVQSLRLALGVNNLFSAMNIRSVPNLLGRQMFVNVQCTW